MKPCEVEVGLPVIVWPGMGDVPGRVLSVDRVEQSAVVAFEGPLPPWMPRHQGTMRICLGSLERDPSRASGFAPIVVGAVPVWPAFGGSWASSSSSMEAVARAFAVVAPILAEHEQVARAFFKSDERLLRFVDEVSDAYIETSDGDELVDEPRIARALELAWERDELGKRTEYLARARKAMAALRGPTPSATPARAREPGVESGIAMQMQLQAEQLRLKQELAAFDWRLTQGKAR